ncbi:MAG TPA: antibiotic biosynthesis monooxygenase [Caulobacterales bacterium]|nr:antibiotic biosynthesis monooxygenase [Caulobacterales bacterium]
MIARVWRGEVPKAKSAQYLHLMRTVALPDYRAVAGNRGAWCLVRDVGEATQFEMLTLWDDVGAIKAFAGEDYERAKYYEFDADYLLRMDPTVMHYEAHAG